MFPSYYITKNFYSQHVNKYQQKPLIFYQNTKELSTENWGKSQEANILCKANGCLSTGPLEKSLTLGQWQYIIVVSLNSMYYVKIGFDREVSRKYIREVHYFEADFSA